MTQPHLPNSEVRAEQAASKKHQTIKLGLDVHADTLVVVRILDHSAPQPAQRFTWAQFRAWIKTQFALAEAVHSCCEAGPFGYGLHRELGALGAATLALEAVAPARRPKGLGGLSYEVVEREVGQWDRFTNRRQLLPITKHGNGRLRTALIELAWRLVLTQTIAGSHDQPFEKSGALKASEPPTKFNYEDWSFRESRKRALLFFLVWMASGLAIHWLIAWMQREKK